MLLELFLLTLSALIFFNWRWHSYWKRNNVFSIPTEFLFGNVRLLLLGKITMYNMFHEMYQRYKEHKIIGFYCFYNPMLLVTDPEIIKRILVTDFNSFHNSGLDVSTEVDPIMGLNPFAAKSIPLWKELRGIQSAHQTPAKLRELIPGFIKVADIMTDYIKNKKNQPVLVQDLATRLTVDFSVLSGFGIEPKSFTDPDFAFMKHATGDKIFTASNLTTLGSFILPWLCRLFSLRMVSKEAEEFFISMTKANIEHRQKANITRNDLFDTLVKLQNKKNEENKVCSQKEISAHCATFYVDASLTTSSVLSFMLLEIAIHQDVQEKLREEILAVGKKLEDFDFEKINAMTYLQMVFDECVRLHSPVPNLSRACSNDTIIDNVKISKGTKIFISALALHYDPEYYPEPLKFDPERFSEVNKQSRVKYTFLPFGEGPRICVGFKYGTLAVKISIISILLKYRIIASDHKTKSLHDPYEFFITPRPDAIIKFQDL